MSNAGQPKVCFLTLGCKVNQTESEALAGFLAGEGYLMVHEDEDPDVIIINTCTVTGTGSSKSRKLIRKIAKDHPKSTLAVMGCYSQTKPEEVAELEGVDLILGTKDRLSILKHLRTIRSQDENKATNTPKSPIKAVDAFESEWIYEELPLIESESRARAMLKVQDGCSQFCTYCIVPYARGPSRSRDPQKVIAETRQLLKSGYKEIVLTGVHIGAYGRDFKEEINLADLITQLINIEGMTRLRLGSVEPMEFTPELIEIITSAEVICPHFHIPLQSGSDVILGRMKRPYSTQEYAQLLAQIRERIPEAAIAADIMTGFPGETEEQHQEALTFIAGCEFASIHAFPYSRRPGTPAADMPDQIPKNVKSVRVRDFIKLANESRQRYTQKFIGKTLEVLVERVDADGSAKGHTRNYLELKLPAQLNLHDWQPGDLVECQFQPEYLVV